MTITRIISTEPTFESFEFIQPKMGGVSSSPVNDISCFHVSCSSDSYDDYMAGLLLLSYKGQEDFQLGGHHIKKGYILIKKSSNINHITSSFGQVHGKLFKWFFGIEPLGCTDVDGYGFSIVDGVWKFKSWTLNDRVTDGIVPTNVSQGIQNAVKNYWKDGTQNYCG